MGLKIQEPNNQELDKNQRVYQMKTHGDSLYPFSYPLNQHSVGHTPTVRLLESTCPMLPMELLKNSEYLSRKLEPKKIANAKIKIYSTVACPMGFKMIFTN